MLFTEVGCFYKLGLKIVLLYTCIYQVFCEPRFIWFFSFMYNFNFVRLVTKFKDTFEKFNNVPATAKISHKLSNSLVRFTMLEKLKFKLNS